MRWSRQIASIVGAVAMAACSDSDGPASPVETAAAPQVEIMAQLAGGIAAVLESPDARVDMLQSMRASQIVDHKLPLDQWLHTTSGRQMADRLGAALRIPADSVHSLVRVIAPVDLFLPSPDDRLTWEGDVTPVVLLAPDRKGVGVRRVWADGTVAGIPDNSSFDVPTVVLQRSEGRSIRIQRQAAPAGKVIQDADDGQEGGTLTIRLPGRPEYVVQLADLERPGIQRQEYCPPEIPGCPGHGGDEDPPGGGGNPGDIEWWGEGKTYLKGLYLIGVHDNGILHESNEFEFETRAVIGYSVIGSSTYRREGVAYNYYNADMNVLLLNNAQSGGAIVDVDVYETDGWPNEDDQFDLVSYSPNQVWFRIPLSDPADKGFWFPLKEQPNIGPFDPEKVFVKFDWINTP